MYFDLFVPFPIPPSIADQAGAGAGKKGKKDKGKAKQPADDVQVKPQEYWSAITQVEKERCTRSTALAGHCTFCRFIRQTGRG